MGTEETVVVATFLHRHQAEMARGYLRQAGLRSVVSADDGGGAFGAPLTFSPSSFATVRVRTSDLDEAREVLAGVGLLEEVEE